MEPQIEKISFRYGELTHIEAAEFLPEYIWQKYDIPPRLQRAFASEAIFRQSGVYGKSKMGQFTFSYEKIRITTDQGDVQIESIDNASEHDDDTLVDDHDVLDECIDTLFFLIENGAYTEKIYHYRPPCDKLLSLGACEWDAECPDYLALGFDQSHIPELIAMACDRDLNTLPEDKPAVWAPTHAWRTLGQLKATETVASLLNLIESLKDWGTDDDWAISEIPRTVAMMGSSAIAKTQAVLSNPANPLNIRISAADALKFIAIEHPNARDAAIRSLSNQLEIFYENSITLNGFIIWFLCDLKAVESAAIIQQAFDEGCVDETIMGDWEDAQVKLGLLKQRRTKRRLNIPDYYPYSPVDTFNDERMPDWEKRLTKNRQFHKRLRQPLTRKKGKWKKKK